jgi:palmitoyltransferase
MDKHAGRQRDVPCLQAMSDARKQRRSRPQPWIVRKFTVGLCIALLGYVCYVYVDRLCVPMIVRKSGALGGRAMGGESFERSGFGIRCRLPSAVAFLVVFSLLLIMLIWTYGKVVILLVCRGVITSASLGCSHITRLCKGRASWLTSAEGFGR